MLEKRYRIFSEQIFKFCLTEVIPPAFKHMSGEQKMLEKTKVNTVQGQAL